MPKFLAGSHGNEEEISRHLKQNTGYWRVQMNGNKFATGQILEKPVEVVKGRILAGLARKSPEACYIFCNFGAVGSPHSLLYAIYASNCEP